MSITNSSNTQPVPIENIVLSSSSLIGDPRYEKPNLNGALSNIQCSIPIEAWIVFFNFKFYESLPELFTIIIASLVPRSEYFILPLM